MRKRILSATFMVAMMAVAGYNVYMSQPNVQLSKLALANVEALADDTELPTVEITCSSTRYGKCCKLTLHISGIGVPINWYCKQSGDPNDSCTWFDEWLANA